MHLNICYCFLMLYLAGYWKDIANRRKVFDEIARDNGFDPLIAANWYSLPKDKVSKVISVWRTNLVNF